MGRAPYSRFAKHELILRDELALDRTLLANERTLLAYLRASVALGIAGVSIMHFASYGWFWTVGVICLPAGLAAAGIGIVRFRNMNASIRGLRARGGAGAEPPAAGGGVGGPPQG